jgi:hypothetical protein
MEWLRIDLHIHTPASKDHQQPDISYLDILKKAESEEMDIIAFTDHNTVASYSAMKQEISDLQRWEASGRLRADEKERLKEYRRLLGKILVLPGFELTATFGFHILGIFDPDTPIRSLEHLLLTLNVPFESLDSGETEVGATSDVLTAYHTIAEEGGLVIAAHANSTHGVAMFGFDFGGQTRIAYTQDPDLHALEVTDLGSNRRRTTASFFNGSKPQYPRRMFCIQGSDSHRIQGKGKDLGVGERATEVLLPEKSFKALKALFLGNDFTRVRPYSRTAAESYDPVEAARNQGPTIVQSFHEQMTRQGGRLHAIMRDVVAFANTNGGTIFVGVSANRRVSPRGIENPEQTIAELRGEIENLVTPPLEVNLQVLKSKGKNIIRIAVPKGDKIPYVLEGSKIYLRQEAETSLAMRDEIVALIKRTLISQPEERRLEPRPATRQPAQGRAPSVPSPESRKKPSGGERAKVPAGGGRPNTNGAQPNGASADDMPVAAPRTGVEIVETVERKGVLYHTMRDLRDGGKVQNVTRNSARRLWRYAIALKEKSTFQDDKVTWIGDLGLWHRYLRAGRTHYDLVQRGPDGKISIYYGVTEDGIHGPWRAVVGMDE